MNINSVHKSKYALSVITLICAVFSAGLLAYNLLNNKQAAKSIKDKIVDSNDSSCRPPEQGHNSQTVTDQENSEESEIFFAGCAGFF